MTGRLTSESYFAISSLQSPVRGLDSLRFALCAYPLHPIPYTLSSIQRLAPCALLFASCLLYSSLTQPAQGLLQYPFQGPLFPLDNGAHGPL